MNFRKILKLVKCALSNYGSSDYAVKTTTITRERMIGTVQWEISWPR